MSIARDKLGDIWFGSGQGVSSYNGTAWQVFTSDNTGLGTSFMTSGFRDPDGILWVGTDGDGVKRFDGHSWITYDATTGLAGDYVYSVLSDTRDAVVWH